MRYLVWKSRVIWFNGWWTVSWDRPWQVITYIWAVLSGFDLWGKCTGSTELEIHSNDRVLGIWHVMVWSSHYIVWWSEFLVIHMIIKVIWVYPCDYYRCYIIYQYHILLIMTLLIFLSPHCLVSWDFLSTFILIYLMLCFRSKLRVWGARVGDVRTQVDPIEVSSLSRVVL
jgi:hypothetical protein